MLVFLSIGFYAQAQTISKREARKVTKEINKNIDHLEKAVNNADWKKIQKVVDQTAKDLNKNADQVIEIVEQIDFSKLASVVKKVAAELEQNVDTRELRKTVEEIGVRIDEVLTQKK